MHSEELPEPIIHLWECLDRARAEQGDPSFAEMARNAAASDGVEDLPESTLRTWWKERTVMPYERLKDLVFVLDAGTAENWRTLHANAVQADTSRKARNRKKGLSPPQHTVPPTMRESDVQPPRSRRLKRIALTGGVALASTAALTLGIWWHRDASGNQESKVVIACAVVTTPNAKVYAAPGASHELTSKKRGATVTLPADVPDQTGPDGRNYRKVRTPERTPSGYAYMLARTLTEVPCQGN